MMLLVGETYLELLQLIESWCPFTLILLGLLCSVASSLIKELLLPALQYLSDIFDSQILWAYTVRVFRSLFPHIWCAAFSRHWELPWLRQRLPRIPAVVWFTSLTCPAATSLYWWFWWMNCFLFDHATDCNFVMLERTCQVKINNAYSWSQNLAQCYLTTLFEIKQSS